MPDVDVKRMAAETSAIIESSVRDLAKLLGGKAAILAIHTEYDETIMFPVVIGEDYASLLKCGVELDGELKGLFADILDRVGVASG